MMRYRLSLGPRKCGLDPSVHSCWFESFCQNFGYVADSIGHCAVISFDESLSEKGHD